MIIHINKEVPLISKGVYNHISDVSLNIPFLLLSHLKMNIKLAMNIHVGTLSTGTKVVARKTSGIKVRSAPISWLNGVTMKVCYISYYL